MAVYRVQRTRDYTVMSNYHLKDKGLTLKSKGLLSMILSLPEEWNYTTRGLASICKEGVDAIGSALKELETAGYMQDVRDCLPDNIPADNHIADEKDRHLRQFREMEQAACKKQHRRHDNACEQVPLFSCHSVFSFRCSIKRVTLFLSIDEKHRLPCGSRCPAFHYALTVTSGSICLISVFASARTASN